MPKPPKHPCKNPRCRNLTAVTYCEACVTGGRTPRRPSAAKQGYGRRWQRLRLMKLARCPLCECGQPATEVHHIVPVRHSGRVLVRLDELEAMCKSCHSKRTAAHGREGLVHR